MTDTLVTILLLVPALVIAIVFHEVAHGLAARALGDPTAQEQRRLSLNPLRHVDPVGTLLVPGFLALVGGPVFGWAKPVPVNARRLNNPRRDMMLVAAAGPGMNLLLAAVGALALAVFFPGAPPLTEILFSAAPLPQNVSAIAILGLSFFILINCFLAFFNLLPIPPFDGSHILEGALPRSMAVHFAKLRQVGLLFFVLLVAASWAFPQFDLIGRLVGPPVEWMLGIYQQLANLVAGA
ncbi:MAG: site-2 protease family protein [Sphingomonadales bacterium]|nr:site-2 protease family protein [Sphingomonadales bacterium]MBD3774544.1 site-2 protease family protein [Paracoccaceae bacterium]